MISGITSGKNTHIERVWLIASQAIQTQIFFSGYYLTSTKKLLENFTHNIEKLNPYVYSQGIVLLPNSPSVLTHIDELGGKNHLL
jgi:hypothetical protein